MSRAMVVLLTTLSGVIVLDQLSKWWLVTSFSLFESRPIIDGFFNLVFVTNSGAAFGLLAGPQVWWRQAPIGIIVYRAPSGCLPSA